MRDHFSRIAALIVMVLMAAWLFSKAPEARAGYELITQSVTIDSGTSETTVTIPMARSRIMDVIVSRPTLNATTNTVTIEMRGVFDGGTYTPNGWSDKVTSASTAVYMANSSQLSVLADGEIKFTIKTSVNQSAARTFKLGILREY